MKNRRLFVLLFGIAFMLNLLGYSYIQYQMSTATTITSEQFYTGEDYPGGDVYVTIVRNKDWLEGKFNHGVQYDVAIHNETNHDLTNWHVSFEIPEGYTITDSWNINYEVEEGHVEARCMDYNTDALARDNLTFGFIVIGKEIIDIEHCVIEYTPVLQMVDYRLFWYNVTLSVVLVMVLIVAAIVELKTASLRKQSLEDKNIIKQTMSTFSNFIDAKDPYTKGHSNRVAIYSRELAKKLKLSDREVELIYYVALLHDIGKILVPDDILKKPGKLTADERQVIETHTINGAEILKDFSAIESIAAGARYHHEHYDGHGYPAGLKGEDIPFLARIICVADSYDAMSSDRCYRSKLSEEQIVEELKNNSGTQFDPEVVKCMLELLETGAFKDMV